jgi:hypothetical protein
MIEDETTFCKAVEELILRGQYDNYMDAVLFVCEENNIEPFVAAKMISQPIKEKIGKEGQDINLLPKTPKLPFIV